jgi:hypothetical protein
MPRLAVISMTLTLALPLLLYLVERRVEHGPEGLGLPPDEARQNVLVNA